MNKEKLSKKQISFTFEFITSLTGIIISILLISLPKFDINVNIAAEFKYGVGIITTLLAIFVIRIRIYIYEQIEKMKQENLEQLKIIRDYQFTEYYKDRKEFVTAKGFAKILEHALEIGATKPELIEEVATKIKAASEGRYSINNFLDIYDHDTKEINKLLKGDFFWSTHRFYSKQEIAKRSVKFDSYIESQKNAAKRGVTVVRIYIIDKINDLNDQKLKHLKEMYDSNIEVRIIHPNKLDTRLSQDFVIISEKMVGVGSPIKGPVERSDFYLNYSEEYQQVYKKYYDYFSAIKKSSKLYKSIE